MTSYTDEQVREVIAFLRDGIISTKEMCAIDALAHVFADRTRLQAEIDAFHRLLPIWREHEIQAYKKPDEYYEGKSYGIGICADHLEKIIASNAIDCARAKKGDV